MAQKVNPIAVRLGFNRFSDSSWFSDYYYGPLFLQDFSFRDYLKTLKQPVSTKLGLRSGRCIIHHYPKRSFIHLFCLGSKQKTFYTSFQLDAPFYSTMFGAVSHHSNRTTPLRFVPSTNQASNESSTPTTSSAIIGSREARTHRSSCLTSAGRSASRKHNIHETISRDCSLFSQDFGGLLETSGWTTITLKNIVETKNNELKQNSTQPLKQTSSASINKTAQRSEARLNYFAMDYFLKNKTNSKMVVPSTQNKWRQDTNCVFLYGGWPALWFQINNWQLSVTKNHHHSFSNMQNVLRNQTNTFTSIIPIQVTSIYQSASLVAQEISYKLEQTKSFRQICKTIFQEVAKWKYIKGIRIACSGRLNGAEIAKTECQKYGETSNHVFSDQIDYAHTKASTPYGILGVKVWISYLQK